MVQKYKGNGLVGGIGEGSALVTGEGIAFNLGVDEVTGVVIETGHELEVECVAGRVVLCRSIPRPSGIPQRARRRIRLIVLPRFRALIP